MTTVPIRSTAKYVLPDSVNYNIQTIDRPMQGFIKIALKHR